MEVRWIVAIPADMMLQVIICQSHFIGAETQEYGRRRIWFCRRLPWNHHPLIDHLGNL
jgi:hypothetical protein